MKVAYEDKRKYPRIRSASSGDDHYDWSRPARRQAGRLQDRQYFGRRRADRGGISGDRRGVLPRDEGPAAKPQACRRPPALLGTTARGLQRDGRPVRGDEKRPGGRAIIVQPVGGLAPGARARAPRLLPGPAPQGGKFQAAVLAKRFTSSVSRAKSRAPGSLCRRGAFEVFPRNVREIIPAFDGRRPECALSPISCAVGKTKSAPDGTFDRRRAFGTAFGSMFRISTHLARERSWRNWR